MLTLRDLPHIPLDPPLPQILRRLRYHARTTVVPERQRAEVERLIRAAAALCEPRGRYGIAPVRIEAETVRPEGLPPIASASLAKLLAKSGRIAVFAATAGGEIVAEVAALSARGRLTEAVIHDAAGSEVAEAAMAYLHGYLGRTVRPQGYQVTRRFSPGYGDLPLSTQRELYEGLRLEELGLTLSERSVLLPEKSVLAIAGIEEAT